MNSQDVITNKNDVIKNIVDFLNSEKKQLMENCYYSIIDSNRNRSFNESLEILDDVDFDSLFPLVSVVVLTANKIECDSFNFVANQKADCLIMKRRHCLPIFCHGDKCSPDAYILKTDISYILHLNAYETGSNTPGGSTDLVRYISNQSTIKPNCIISFGICYGRNPQKQQIGDVLIPKKLYPWSIGQKINENKFEIKHDDFNLNLEHELSNSQFYSILRDYCNDEDGMTLKEDFPLKCKEQKVTQTFFIKNTFGNMSTGEAVVSSGHVKNILQKATHNEKEIGGEMEGYGIAKECIFYAKTPFFLIKAICDWGECKNINKELFNNGIECPEHLKDKLQAYAAFCAAISLFNLLNREKNRFLSVPLLTWMDDARRRKARCSEFNYVAKDIVIKNIRSFFSITYSSANNIFDCIIKNGILESNNEETLYHVKKGRSNYANN